MDNFILEEEVDDTFAFMSNVTICDMCENNYEGKLVKFQQAARRWNLAFNDDKCTFRKTLLNFIGYNIKHGEIKLDDKQLKPYHKYAYIK